jgi:DNA topoisomerase VI subunit A
MSMHLDGRTMSQRDVYYTLKHLFETQVECNKCILDLGLCLGLKRCKFNVLDFNLTSFK